MLLARTLPLCAANAARVEGYELGNCIKNSLTFFNSPNRICLKMRRSEQTDGEWKS